MFTSQIHTSIFRHLGSLAACMTILLSSAHAAEYEYIWDPPTPVDCEQNVPGVGFGRAGILTHLESTFNDVTNIFVWTATFEPCNDKLPDGYWNVINNGPNPKGHSGELAIIYFDASNPSDPKITAYAYNGQNGDKSYKDGVRDDDLPDVPGQPGNQTPDRIASNISGDTSWVQEISVTDNGNTRTMHLKIDATGIITHVPLYPDIIPPYDSWYGLGYDHVIGFWFHPSYGTHTVYCGPNSGPSTIQPKSVLPSRICSDVAPGQTSEGYLEDYRYTTQGWYDLGNKPTNDVPFCQYTLQGNGQQTMPKDCIELAIGEAFSASITGIDTDDDSLFVSYSGQPSGSIIDPNIPIGDVLKMVSPAEVSIDWTPTLAHAGSNFSFDVSYTDPHGATKVCSIPLCVPQNDGPTCDIQLTTDNVICQGDITVLDFDASGSFDPDNDDLTYEWSTTCLNDEGNPETITILNGGEQAQLSLTQPGKGVVVDCEMIVTVTDEFNQSSTCSTPVHVEGCDIDTDCTGTPGGNATVDLCGVCNGNNECLDCFNVPFGDATIDQCGVCGGDGTSCLECESTEIVESQFQLDQGAKKQEAIIDYHVKLIKNINKKQGPKLAAWLADVQFQAHELQTSNWVLSWQLPNVIDSCTNTELCVTVSNLPILDTYRAQSIELFELGKTVVKKWYVKKKRKLKKAGKLTSKKLAQLKKKRRKLKLAHKNQHEVNMNILETVPTEFSSCT
ncbi:MAG: hypothetical protein KDD55_00640 [Bdellovibrionales bacterium]|nr:hypothetical protein [Bdellovibrionales bacterium]